MKKTFLTKFFIFCCIMFFGILLASIFAGWTGLATLPPYMFIAAFIMMVVTGLLAVASDSADKLAEKNKPLVDTKKNIKQIRREKEKQL